MMREMWMMQNRFTFRNGQRAFRLMEHQRFRAAYDFLCLRSESGEIDDELCKWWTLFQEVDVDERKEMINKLPPLPGKRRKRKKRTGPNNNNSSEKNFNV